MLMRRARKGSIYGFDDFPSSFAAAAAAAAAATADAAAAAAAHRTPVLDLLMGQENKWTAVTERETKMRLDYLFSSHLQK